jgi:Integrase core domain
LTEKRYLLFDRDPLYTREFRTTLRRGGVKVLRLPPQSPDLNAFAERFVLSIRSECLDRIVPLGEAHIRRAVREYVEHYHGERNQQGLANRLIVPGPDPANSNGAVGRRERLGGLLKFTRVGRREGLASFGRDGGALGTLHSADETGLRQPTMTDSSRDVAQLASGAAHPRATASVR